MSQTGIANLDAAFEALTEHWSPKVVAQVNDHLVKVAKLQGEFVWHAHDDEDELFHVVSGRLVIQYEGGREVVLGPGDLHVVPRGVRHNPVAAEEVRILLIEPVATRHTGELVHERTRSLEEQLR